MKICRKLTLTILLVHASGHAALRQPIDVSSEFLRYRHNAQARAVFGEDLSNDPEVQPKTRFSLYFETAKSQSRAKQYLAAINNYSRAIAILSTVPTLNNRGGDYFEIGDLDAAERDFSSALLLDPNDMDVWVNLGNLMIKRNQYEKAINCFSHAIAAGDQRAITYVSRGNAYELNNDRQNALWDYDTAIAMAPQVPGAHVAKSWLFLDAGKLEEAESELNAALMLDPNYTDATLALARLRSEQHRYADAIAAYTSALKARPTQALIFADRAQAWGDAGDWSQAIADYSRAIALERDNVLLLRLRGLAYDHQGNYADAVADFKESIRVAPDSPRSYVLWAGTLVHAAQAQRAVDVLSEAIKQMPDAISLRRERANSLEQLGDYQSAIAEYRAILQTHADDTDSRRYLADDETTLGHYDEAAGDFDVVSRSKPDDDGLLYGRAQLNFYTGDFRRADADLSKWQTLYREEKVRQGSEQPYYVAIWRHIIALKLSMDDRVKLVKQASDLASSRWPYPVLAFYMGKSTVAGLLSAVDSSVKDRENHLCEANAYLGEWLLAHGDRSGARQNFEAASAKCPVQFIEKTLARRELQRMSQVSAQVPVPSSNANTGSQSQSTAEEMRRPSDGVLKVK